MGIYNILKISLLVKRNFEKMVSKAFIFSTVVVALQVASLFGVLLGVSVSGDTLTIVDFNEVRNTTSPTTYPTVSPSESPSASPTVSPV